MATDPGWTEAEYMQCPELAGRLHDHILNLQAEVKRLRSERDRAVETRENANSASVRVQIENQRLRGVERAAREMFEVVENEFPSIHVMRWRTALIQPAGAVSDE